MLIYKNKVIMHLFKAAGSSIIDKVEKDYQNLSYCSSHDNMSVLSADNLSFAKNYEQLMVVRNPYTWYRSFYNYVKGSNEGQKHDAMSAILMFKPSGEMLSYEEYVKNATNLKKTFTPEKILQFRKDLTKRRNGYLKAFFGDLTKLEFKEESYLTFVVKAMSSDKTQFFRMEDELEKFLKYAGVGSIKKRNVSKIFVTKNNPELDKIIYEVDKELFKRWGYEK